MAVSYDVTQLDVNQRDVVLGHAFNELRVVLITIGHRCIAQANGPFQLLPCGSDVIAFSAGRFLAELLALAADPLDGVRIKVLVAKLVEQLLSLCEDATLHLRCASDVRVACRTHDGAAHEV